MTPVVLATEVLQVLLQEYSHADDAIGHALDLSEPLFVQHRIVEDRRGNPSAVHGRVGVQRADEDLDLGLHPLLLLDRLAHDGESSHTLTVETLQFDASHQPRLGIVLWRSRSWIGCFTMFFAKDWHKAILWPSEMKCLTANASLLVSPLAKPW